MHFFLYLDKFGNSVVNYVYDAWGNHVALDSAGLEITDPTHVGILNPYRYYSYYYDTETGLYHLKARYYDPNTGRFISPDDFSYLDPESINGLNLYAYCANNPVMNVDPNGTFIITATMWFIIGASMAAGFIVGGIMGGITAAATGQDILTGILAGAIGGAIMGFGAGLATAFMAPMMVGYGGFLATAIGAGKTFLMGKAFGTAATMLIGAGFAFGAGFVGGAVTDIINQVGNHGRIYDVGSIFISGIQWGGLNMLSAFAGVLGGPVGGSLDIWKFLSLTLASAGINIGVGFMGLFFDVLRNSSIQEE